MLNRIRLTSFSSHSFSLKFLNKALSSLKISKRFSDAEKNRLPDFKITSFSNSRSKLSKFLEIEFLMVLIKISLPVTQESLKSNSHLPKKHCFICFNESLLKMMKNGFYFILKALFVLKKFKYLS